MSANLHGRGITLFDADDRGGDATARLQCSAGTIDVTVGNSGVVITSGDTSNNVLLTGTITELDNLFRGRTTGTIVYTRLVTTGAVTFTITVTDQDGQVSVITFPGIVANYVPPVIGVPGGTVNVQVNAANNLHGLGFTVTDADDVDEYATMTIVPNHGTVTVTPGNSGTTVTSGNGTALVTVVGTITKLNGLLTDAGTGTITYTPTTTGTKNIVFTVTDGDGQVGTNNKNVVSKVAPEVTAPSAFIAAVTSVNENIHGAGFSVADSDASGTQTMVLTTTGGTITVAAGDSGVTIASGNGTAAVTVTGTLAQLNHLLQDTGTGTIVYLRAIDTTETFTVTVTDDSGLVDAGSVEIVTATGTTWSGYATATPLAISSSFTNYVGVVDLAFMPADWWAAVSSDGRDIRVTTDTLGHTTSIPRDLVRFDYANERGLLLVKYAHSATPPVIRIWVGASNATAPAAGDANGQHAVYASSVFRAFWPYGGGDDRTSYANHLTMTGATAGNVNAATGTSFLATTYALGAQYGVTTVSVPNDIPELLICFVKPTSSASAQSYVSTVHGTVRNILGQSSNKVRAKTDIQGGTDNDATSSGSLTTGSWQQAAGMFGATNSRAAYRDGGSASSNSGTSTGAAGTDAYIIGGLGTDTGAAVSVNPDLSADICMAFIQTVAGADAAARAASYKNVMNQPLFWGTWTWATASQTGL